MSDSKPVSFSTFLETLTEQERKMLVACQTTDLVLGKQPLDPKLVQTCFRAVGIELTEQQAWAASVAIPRVMLMQLKEMQLNKLNAG
jgi:hypothetical protein